MAKGSRAKKSATKKSSTKKASGDGPSIDSLLKKLKGSGDKSEKRSLRIQLRKAGHTGGLRVSK